MAPIDEARSSHRFQILEGVAMFNGDGVCSFSCLELPPRSIADWTNNAGEDVILENAS